MKETDLMIGDWVNYQYNTNQVKPAKVVRLSDSGSIELAFNNGMSVATNIKYITPILLISEILEKNGFKDLHEKEVYELKSLNSRTHLGIDLDSHEIYLQDDGCEEWPGYKCYTLGTCEFVHELQHLIKSHKIEKEILWV